MKRLAICLAAISVFSLAKAESDPAIRSVQQSLKDQGFYYGQITGNKDADTAAAIRRYQIRNGLQITGELNNETRKSLGVKGSLPAATPKPVPQTTPPFTPQPPPPKTPPREDARRQQEEPFAEDEEGQAPPLARMPAPNFGRAQPGFSSLTSDLFGGTPYELAAPETQRRVLIGAQSLLSRQGLYRGLLDGIYGPGMQFALRAYQSRFGIVATGRLDTETLAALGLLPGQRAPGFTAPRRRFFGRPGFNAPRGERIYTPNPY